MSPAENYILKQPEPYRTMLMHLQLLIEKTVPDAELKYKYRIPFYYIADKPFCYLNQSKNYVDVGFWHSAYLTKNLEYMVSEKRKILRSLRYKNPEEINVTVLTEVLQEAYSFREKKFYK